MSNVVQKLIVGLVIVVILGSLVIGALMGAAVYGWRAALLAGNEVATLHILKTLAELEIQYSSTHDRSFGTFAQLVDAHLLGKKFEGDPPTADGYIFTMTLLPGGTGRMSFYTLKADPQGETTGRSHFYLDSNSSE